MASAVLVYRLKDLRDKRETEAFEIFDGPRIEEAFFGTGLSKVLLQHLPKSHTALRPIHPLLGELAPLECEVCGRDLLKMSLRRGRKSVILFFHNDGVIEEVHFACKGKCDDQISKRSHAASLSDSWDDIEDYCNPLIFVRRITGYVAQMRNAPESYSESAHKK